VLRTEYCTIIRVEIRRNNTHPFLLLLPREETDVDTFVMVHFFTGEKYVMTIFDVVSLADQGRCISGW